MPEDKKLEKIAEILRVNTRLIRPYDLNDSEDLYYIMLWLEELCPNFTVTRQSVADAVNDTQKYLSERYFRWHEMRKKYRTHEITYDEYWEWKAR